MSKTFNIFLVFAILFGPIIVLSQGYYNRYDYRRKRHEFTLGGGASNFLGELGGRDMVGSGFIYDLDMPVLTAMKLVTLSQNNILYKNIQFKAVESVINNFSTSGKKDKISKIYDF